MLVRRRTSARGTWTSAVLRSAPRPAARWSRPGT